MEATWISAARAGDERAAAALFEKYQPRLRRSVVRWTEDAEAAEDVCQEVWLRAFQALSRFRGNADFGTWLYAIARNLVTSGARRARRRTRLMAAHDHPARVERPQPVELRLDLQRAVAALPAGQRKVLWLHDVEGWKHAEIAVALGIREGTSKGQLFKARTTLRRRLHAA